MTETMGIRLSLELRKKVDALALRLSKPGDMIAPSTAARIALERGLEIYESAEKAVEKSKAA